MSEGVQKRINLMPYLAIDARSAGEASCGSPATTELLAVRATEAVLCFESLALETCGSIIELLNTANHRIAV